MPRFIIEARNLLYQRIGLVENYTSFEAIIRLNATGSWSLTVPGNAPEVGYLQPGNGIIVRVDGQPEAAFSGPVTKISRNWGESNLSGAGTVTISGVTDERLLFERVTYPIPANDLDHQTDDRYVVYSNAAYLMKYLVRENCGVDALPERQYPELDVSNFITLGGQASVSTRFEVLGEKLQEIANSHSLGFHVRQGTNDRLLFDVFAPQDKRELVFSKESGNLQAYSYDLEAPDATRVIFAAQGEGKDRYFTDATYDAGLVQRWDDRDSRIQYSASAELTSNTEAYRGTYTELDVAGRTMTFDFTGTGFRLYGRHQDTFSHTNNISIDGAANVVFSTTGPVDTPRVKLYELSGLEFAKHRIVISSFYGFWVDFVDIRDDRVTPEWYRNSERFYDRRDIPVAWNTAHTSLIDPSTGSPADPGVYNPLFDQATLEAWDENGPKATLSMTPIDTESVKYGRDYHVGDIVTVEIDGVSFTEVLREVRLSDGDDGPRITPTLGDSQASSTPTIYKTVRRLWSKVRRLEAQ